MSTTEINRAPPNMQKRQVLNLCIYIKAFKVNPYLQYLCRCLLQCLYECHKYTYHLIQNKTSLLQKFPTRDIHNK